ncbi:hypothetical protein GJ496_000432 [Pomphorhynchus laevis]|nr:hypothetical protein GJ496_000432 [Pomphorhynchus laevis]
MTKTVHIKTKYSHPPGISFIAHNDLSCSLITCGEDGEVRIWHDDDFEAYTVAESCTALATKDDKLFVGTERCTVAVFYVESGLPDGHLMSFQLPATFITTTHNSGLVIAGSAGSIKYLTGHRAPILALACDAHDKILCSSSCDGTIRLWNIESQTVLKSFELLSSCQDCSMAKLFCRVCWAFDDQVLIPCKLNVTVVDSKLLRVDSVFATEFYSGRTQFDGCQSVAFCKFSQLVIVGFGEGTLRVYNKQHTVMATYSTMRQQVILQLVIIPYKSSNPEFKFAFITKQGYTGMFKYSKLAIDDHNAHSTIAENYDDVFKDDDEFDLDSQQEDISLDAVKEAINEKYSNLEDIDLDDVSMIKEELIDETASIQIVQYRQPSSTPIDNRYCILVWNDVGAIFKFEENNENSIDVEFHDNSHHHNIYISNENTKFFAADLSSEAIALASDKRIRCILYGLSALSRVEWETDCFGANETLKVHFKDFSY